MIVLSNLLDDLAYGEFANMAIGNSELGSITPDKYPRIMSAVNLGLVELYTRFRLKESEAFIAQQTGMKFYPIRSTSYYVTNPDGGMFPDDLLKVLKVYNSIGYRQPLDDISYPSGVFTVEVDVLSITNNDPLDTLRMVYQASHTPVLITPSFDPETIKLTLPDFAKRALLAFVASRIFVGKASKQTEGVQERIDSTFLYLFEKECEKIAALAIAPSNKEQEDLYPYTYVPFDQFCKNGWV